MEAATDLVLEALPWAVAGILVFAFCWGIALYVSNWNWARAVCAWHGAHDHRWDHNERNPIRELNGHTGHGRYVGIFICARCGDTVEGCARWEHLQRFIDRAEKYGDGPDVIGPVGRAGWVEHEFDLHGRCRHCYLSESVAIATGLKCTRVPVPEHLRGRS